MFTLSRPFIAEIGDSETIFTDLLDGLFFSKNGNERISYKIYSDRKLPEINNLRLDEQPYSIDTRTRFLQLPLQFDERITQLATRITKNQNNRYDKAKALENYLQTQFGYTLQLKATGEEPLADFLFNVREGHCEYFATAMAVMLRTQGIAARIVNGFQQGEYNETADVYVVRQSEAHSWVEVYFPGEDVWIPFDPTPFAGQFTETKSAGIIGTINNYLEALETFWIEYFVAYDTAEQRSLFRSVKSGFVDFQAKTSTWMKIIQIQVSDWWTEVRGDKGLQASAIAIAYGIGYVLAGIFGLFFSVDIPKDQTTRILDKIQ